jgi:hypothetical protein
MPAGTHWVNRLLIQDESACLASDLHGVGLIIVLGNHAMPISHVYASTRMSRPPSLDAEGGSKAQQTSGAGANARSVRSGISTHRIALKDNARNHVLMNVGDKSLTGIRDAYSLQSASQRGAIVFKAALLARLGAQPLPPTPLPRATPGTPMPATNLAAHLAQPDAPPLPPPPPPLSLAMLDTPMSAPALSTPLGAPDLPALPPLPQAKGGVAMPPIRATTAPPIPGAPASAGPSTPGATSTVAAPTRNRATTIVQTRSVDPYTGVALKGKTLERFNANRNEHTPSFTRMANVARFVAAQDGGTPLKCLELSQSESPDFGFGFAVLPEARSNKPLLMSERERIATYTGTMSILDNVSLRARVDPLTLAVMDGAMAEVNRKLKNNQPVTADDVREAFTMIAMDLSIPKADAAQTATKIGLKKLKALHTALTAAGNKEIRLLADDKAVSGVGLKAIQPKKVVYPIKLNHPDTAVQVHEPVMRQRATAATHQLLLVLLDKWVQDPALTSATRDAITAAKRSMASRLSKAEVSIRASDVEYAFRKILDDLGSS